MQKAALWNQTKDPVRYQFYQEGQYRHDGELNDEQDHRGKDVRNIACRTRRQIVDDHVVDQKQLIGISAECAYKLKTAPAQHVLQIRKGDKKCDGKDGNL